MFLSQKSLLLARECENARSLYWACRSAGSRAAGGAR